jgi:pimeloyl-ACP methyl ester carboxylesterase
VMLFLHGVGGINNGPGCQNPGLTTQFPLLDPAYAAKVEHIVLVPVAKQPNWRHHYSSAMSLVDMALSDLGGDPRRVTIAGQSMGAHGAYLYATELAPGRFCALVVMCGYLSEEGPIGNVVPSAILGPLKSTPIWILCAPARHAAQRRAHAMPAVALSALSLPGHAPQTQSSWCPSWLGARVTAQRPRTHTLSPRLHRSPSTAPARLPQPLRAGHSDSAARTTPR